jgi:dihydroorotate dehydrogenase (fumarate)
MTDISSIYMGIKLKSPFIVGASSLTSDLPTIKKAEAAGAGAIVIKSLFEEQIQAEASRLEESLQAYSNMIAEAVTFHADYDHAGPTEHLRWIEKTRKEINIPLIASLNAISPGSWTEYASNLADAGADAIELNLYGIVTDANVSDDMSVQAMKSIAEAVKRRVSIPVSVKLTPWLLSPGYAAKTLDQTGIDGIVLFNRFARFDIDPTSESVRYSMAVTASRDLEHSLRWTSLLQDHLNADLCGSSGIHTAEDAVKMILAGASAVQTVSALYQKGIHYIHDLNLELSNWMKQKNYKHLSDFQGNVSKSKSMTPYTFERHQYIKATLGIH